MRLPVLTLILIAASFSPMQAQTIQTPSHPPHPPTSPYGSYPRVWTQGPGVYGVQASGRGSYLGVGLLELDAERAGELGMAAPRGVEVSSVARNSPAANGGLRKADVILEFRGEPVVGVDHFVRLVRETPVGREVSVRLWRDGAENDLTLTVGRRKLAEVYGLRLDCEEGEDCRHPGVDFTMPSIDFTMPTLHIDLSRPRMVLKSRALGAELEGLKNKQQLAEFFGVESGAFVRSVDADSAAERAGLKAGDVIVAVDGKPADTAQRVSKLLRSAVSDQPVALDVVRSRVKKTLTLEPSRRGSNERPSRRPGRGVSVEGGEKL